MRSVCKVYDGLVRRKSWLFGMTLFAAVLTVWIAERPPMVDLPQHLAQVVEWRALIEGRFAYADLVRLNYATPYLLAYGLLLPLTYVVSATTAAKLVLSISFLAFVGLCKVLRRELGGDRRLDWLFLFGFFGFAWRFGFLQYLCAAPIVILFLIVALHQARANSPRNQLALLFVGVLLLLSHALQFIFAVAIGGLFILFDRRDVGYKLRAYVPYYIFAFVAAFLWWSMSSSENFTAGARIVFDDPFYNRFKIPLYILGNDRADWWAVMASVVAVSVPILFQFRIARLPAWIPLAACVTVLLFVPHIWSAAAFVYHRFALFLVPFWALAFSVSDACCASIWLDRIRFAVLAIAALAATAIQAQRQFEFRNYSAGFETILAAAEPNRLALSLIYASNEPNSAYPVYRNYASWYAVEKGGFVDFNFAFYINSIVRYRGGKMPTLSKSQGFLSPESNISNDLPFYSYLFIRGTSQEVDRMMKANQQCLFTLRAADNLWWLYEKKACIS